MNAVIETGGKQYPVSEGDLIEVEKIEAQSGDRVIFEPLRNPEGLGTLLTVTLSTAFHTYRVAIRKYRPAEEAAFDAKYRNEWRERFRSIPDVDVKAELQSGYS